MSTTYRRLACSPERVFEVLADGWLFPSWVVGASRMRDVDANWPAVESKLQHSFGVWPVLIDDSTSMMEWDPPRRAKLRARGWPMGEAEVALDVKRRGDGCVVRITEKAVRGPGKFVPAFIMDPPLHVRNIEALRRLAYLAEGGAGRVSGADKL